MGTDPKTVPLEPQRSDSSDYVSGALAPEPKKPWWHSVKEPGSAIQIVIAALLAIAIGLIVTTQANQIPAAVPVILMIPGELWLRALKAVVLPLIICSMILAVQRLRAVSQGASRLAKWTILYYVATTLIAIVSSCLMVSLVWGPMFTQASEEALAVPAGQSTPKASDTRIESVVRQMFMSFIPDNVVKALANNELLAVLVTSIVVGYLIESEESSILRAVVEVERIITTIVTALIKMAPIGVFFLILPSLMRLRLADIGRNLAVLIGGTLSNMFIHLFVVVPAIFFAVTRRNPYLYWFKNASAWITAWGSASSAATLPVTLRCGRARGISETVCKFVLPLGCLINMDGTAIYFPMVVVFLARTNGIVLGPTDYVIICLLATLSSIGTTPIPSASLVLSVMIAGSVGVPVTGMYAVVVAIDWFLDRFRTALNISGDLYGAMVVYRITKIEDPDEAPGEAETAVQHGEERV